MTGSLYPLQTAFSTGRCRLCNSVRSRTLRPVRKASLTRKPRHSLIRTEEYKEADLPILGEVLCAAELVLLHATPLYYGFGIPHGDGAPVVLIPAFLCPDA